MPSALAAGLACLLLVLAAALTAWPARSPLFPDNAGRLTGETSWAWVYFACAAAAFLAYLLGLACLRRGGRLVLVAVLAIAIQVAPLAGPLLLSTDAWTYWDYGRIAAVHARDPYDDPPASVPSDPAYRWVGAGWRHTTSVYGPGFTLASEPLALAAGTSHSAAAWVYKSLAALATLATAGLATFLSPRRSFACAFVGWNPLLAVHFAGGGHNDAWMAALVLGALALAATGRRQLAGVAWVLAASIKWVPLLLLPLHLLEARAAGRPVRLLGFGLAAAAVAALATWRYDLSWLQAFGSLARNANRESKYALPHRLESVGAPHFAALALFGAAFVVAYALLARAAARGRARLGLATVLLLLAAPYLAAWYAVWSVPLAAAEDDRAAQWLSLALCAYLLRQTVPL
jgi:hypothetical protein